MATFDTTLLQTGNNNVGIEIPEEIVLGFGVRRTLVLAAQGAGAFGRGREETRDPAAPGRPGHPAARRVGRAGTGQASVVTSAGARVIDTELMQ
jgi:hypothetical protein